MNAPENMKVELDACKIQFSARHEALACAARGWPVFPMTGIRAGLCTCGHEHDAKHIGNHPCLGLTSYNATTNENAINGWFDQDPDINYGIATGLELDNSGRMLAVLASRVGNEAALATIASLEATGAAPMLAAEALTGDGIVQLYLTVNVGTKLNASVGAGQTIHGVGGDVIGPGSMHRGGAQCVWIVKPTAVANAAPTEHAIGEEAALVLAPAACPQMPSRADAPLHISSTVLDQAPAPDRAGQIAPNLTPSFVTAPAPEVVDAEADIQELAQHFDALEHQRLAAKAAIERMGTVRSFAATYIESGWKLCRITKGTKAPKYDDWQSNPISLHSVGDHGLGLIHALSGTCAIDLDDLKNAEGWFASKGIDIGDLLHADDAVKIKSGRNNRAKLLFRLPSDVGPLDTVQIKNNDGSMMVEFRCASDGGSGCQDVLPPTVHPDTGKPYEWAGAGDHKNLPTLPAALLTLWLNRSISKTPPQGVVSAPGGNIAEGGRNLTLFKRGGDMARLGLSIDAIEAVLLLENAKRCSPPLPDAEVRRIAVSANKGSLGAKAAANAELSVVEQSELLKQATLVIAGEAAANKPQLDVMGSRLPAVMNAMVGYCNTNARTVQPAFALCTALASCSSILARDFTGAAGAHTNLYCIAIGPTACGKENTLRTVAKIVAAYDATRIAGVPASDSGVLTAVKRNPASVFIIDEIGEVLKSIFDPKAASHKAMIGTTFMELYTKGGHAYRGKEYALQTGAGGRAREDIFSPNPSIFGATTATTFYEGMNSAAINSGFLPRIMVFRAPDLIPLPNTAYAPCGIPEIVNDWLDAIRVRVAEHIRGVAQKGNLTGATSDQYTPIDVPYSEAAHALFVAEQIKIVHRRNAGIDPLESNMLSRLIENAGRVALTLALAEDPSAVEVSANCFLHAMEIVNQCSTAFMGDIRANLFDSNHAELENKVLQKITQHYVEKKGKPISDGVLVDRCKPYGSARPQDRKNAIDALVRQGKVTVEGGRNAGSVRYLPRYQAE